jgi:hypothetical protein
MTTSDLKRLSGAIVLIRSSRDKRVPPTAMRGTIEIHTQEDGVTPAVMLALDYPQMFNAPAHHRTIALSDRQVDVLIASERDGVYQIELDIDLNPTQ